VLELDSGLEFDVGSAAKEFFPALPERAAVCLIELRDEKTEPYLIRTQDLRRRLQRLLGPIDPASKKLNLRDHARGVRYRVTGSAFEQTFTYYFHAKRLFPKRYKDLMRLRPPAVIKVNLKNAYPRCYATRRIPVDENGAPSGGAYYGPFASRKSAEAFAGSALDLFKVRRCQIKIRRDPTFPGCLYSEMKMCLAPCFAGCTKEEYDTEVQRVVQFLETGGGSLRENYEEERGKASEQLDFERAALWHKKVEKLDEVLRGQPELARRIQDLDAVILQRSAEEQTIGVYAVRGGRLQKPYFLRFAEIASQPRSAERIFRDLLEGAGTPEQAELFAGSAATAAEKGDLGEHLWMVARWYYSNPRDGEIFFREKDWPYRRILRACSRLLAPKPEAEAHPAAGPAATPEGAS
jgi:excinuclease UvrABC nuclease subunit